MVQIDDERSHLQELSTCYCQSSCSSLAQGVAPEDDQDGNRDQKSRRSVRCCALLVALLLATAVASSLFAVVQKRHERNEWIAKYGDIDLIPAAAPTVPTADLTVLGGYTWSASEDEDETVAGIDGPEKVVVDEIEASQNDDDGPLFAVMHNNGGAPTASPSTPRVSLPSVGADHVEEMHQSTAETGFAAVSQNEETRTQKPMLRPTPRPSSSLSTWRSLRPTTFSEPSNNHITTEFTTHSYPYDPYEVYLPPEGRPTDIFMLLQSALSQLQPAVDGSQESMLELNYPHSPSHRTYQWIVEEDPMQLSPEASNTAATSILLERYAMASLYVSTGGLESGMEQALFRPTEGKGWVHRENYLSGLSVCDWYGAECDLDGRVIGLHLAENGLDASALPPELSLLRKLRLLDLRANELAGKLPQFLSSFLNLQFLDLSENKFEGAIPQELYDVGTSGGEMANLEHLDLGGCHLTGTLSADGVAKWSGLKFLSLEDNFLSGVIPEEIVAWTVMEHLNLGKNNFEKSFPWFAVTTNMTSLRSLLLYSNTFSGALPDEVSEVRQLTHLSLQNNKFTGYIPIGVGKLDALRALYLHGTELSGTVPESFGALFNLGESFGE
mmetsp:Transcript_61112/g.180766  ORF Transcript_61112/g.180766 Transcript_61112/m.180766 type:complete len:612 (-) Transcript_61112:13-1848(-)